MNNDTYNGWTNRETWLVNLHLTNDQDLYTAARSVVLATFHTATVPEHVVGITTERQWAINRAADDLREHVEILTEQYSHGPAPAVLLVRDLLTNTLADVDWHEVAEGLLE